MPQAILPLFPDDVTPINNIFSFANREGMVYYFQGTFPVFTHAEDDQKSFKMFVSQLYINGSCKQSEIVRAFGVSPISVKRWVKKYRQGGVEAFFSKPKKRKPRVMTPEIITKAQEFLDEGRNRSWIAKELNLKPDTLYQAVRSGRLTEHKKKAKRA
jgi:transposase